MNLHKTKNIMLLAVCCELRDGLKNNHILKLSEKVGDFFSTPEYQLVRTLNNYDPVGLKKGNNSVVFEVYRVNTIILEEVSKLKSFYNIGYKHNFNEKKIIETPYGKAIAYFNVVTEITKQNKICDYDYLDYNNYIKHTN